MIEVVVNGVYVTTLITEYFKNYIILTDILGKDIKVELTNLERVMHVYNIDSINFRFKDEG